MERASFPSSSFSECRLVRKLGEMLSRQCARARTGRQSLARSMGDALDSTNRAALILILATLVVPAVTPAQRGWVSIGPEIAPIEALAIDQQVPGALYAATTRGRVYKSSDGGGRWHLVFRGSVPGHVTFLAVAPSTSAVVYVGHVQPWGADQVFKSVDGGENWNSITMLYGVRVEVLAFDPKTPTTIYGSRSSYGAVERGILKSTDGGRTWRSVNRDIVAYRLVIDPQTPKTLFAATAHGIFKSTDGGNTWRAANTGVMMGMVGGLPALMVSALAIDPKSPSSIYAATWDIGYHYRVYKSTDGGDTWKTLVYLRDVQVSNLIVDPRSPTTLYASALRRIQGNSAALGGVFKSIDGGETWRSVSTGLTSRNVSALVIDPRVPTTLFAGTINGGVFKSTDGAGTWQGVNSGLNDVDATAIAIDPQNPRMIYAGTADVGAFRSTDGGRTWNPLRLVPAERCAIYSPPLFSQSTFCGPQVTTVDIDPQTPATIYIGTRDDGLFKSTDGGTTWRPVDMDVQPLLTGVRPLWISAVAIDPRIPATIYVGAISTGIPIPEPSRGIGVFKSTDGGTTWSRAGASVGESFGVSALAVDPEKPTTLYAGTTGSGVFKSSDGGESWHASNTGLTDRVVRKLIIDPRMPATLYVATGDSISKSSDGGATWRVIHHHGVWTLALDPRFSTTIYAGTSAGVMKSNNGGDSWNAINVGLAMREVRALAVDPKTPTIIYAGTSGGGVFILRQ